MSENPTVLGPTDDQAALLWQIDDTARVLELGWKIKEDDLPTGEGLKFYRELGKNEASESEGAR